MDILSFSIFARAGILPQPTHLVEETPDPSRIEDARGKPELLVGLYWKWLFDLVQGRASLNWQNLLLEHDPQYLLFEKHKSALMRWQQNHRLQSVPAKYEKDILEILSQSISQAQFDFEKLYPLLNCFDEIEKKIGLPFLFNVEIKCENSALLNAVHALANFLFYLRVQIAQTFNQEIRGNSFEVLKIDPVLDYLPMFHSLPAEARVFSSFKRFESQLPTLVSHKLRDEFLKELPMSVTLIFSVERAWKKNTIIWESDVLQEFQLSWLYGAYSGILFRLREELVGIKNGYQNTFYKHSLLPRQSSSRNQWLFAFTVPDAQFKVA
ncbi:MAG: hypothetical protein NZ480_01090 [Bdellovibrionaceae bacterium]|nr:hypothetical protein [Pseudobdellovibrionaceae bacterium]MDW8190788.1 hypothetical protein [Pseudobdellovibrionaceae bacterium]